jgi:hypothetical protein
MVEKSEIVGAVTSGRREEYSENGDRGEPGELKMTVRAMLHTTGFRANGLARNFSVEHTNYFIIATQLEPLVE